MTRGSYTYVSRKFAARILPKIVLKSIRIWPRNNQFLSALRTIFLSSNDFSILSICLCVVNLLSFCRQISSG
ncbi:unknown protein [Desulfotalea psychrophila LSv54]|uniref:Uncharacterized protein n=1 Tax=Desulfotalea psychrophila (strain LSv54 / DSM 12343) TaxID=177439 RepID=Q6AKN2_DESPS|nr:unknown protein [Desulfotalea psychrophila LSv54]